MIIVRTPYRMSLLGGGSDLPAFYSTSPGMVISTTLKQYMYISVHPTFEDKQIKLKYSKIETASDPATITHPIVKAALTKLGVSGVEITSVGDIPAQTGLGSSSSFTVGLLHALHTHLGNGRTKEELAQEACEIEIDVLKEPIGKQDQYAAAYGGLQHYTFNSNNTVTTQAVSLPMIKQRELEQSLLLFYTGETRSASKVLAEQSKNISSNKNKSSALQRMVDMVPLLRRELERGNIESLGEYLHEGWQIKRDLASSITNPEIDGIYNRALKLGATGGKILGAGGGGFLLFYCPPSRQEGLIKGLGLKCLPVEFDSGGSQVVYST